MATGANYTGVSGKMRPGAGGEAAWLGFHGCTLIQLSGVALGDRFVVWTMHCSMATDGSQVWADSAAANCSGATNTSFDTVLGWDTQSGLYFLTVTSVPDFGASILAWSPTDDTLGDSSSMTVLVHRIPAGGSSGFTDCG